MQVSSSQTRVGFAKFTPKAILEFSLISGINKEELKRRINMASYEPCIESETGCFPIATINSIAKAALHVTSGNRASVPDAMIIISSTAYRIPELGVGETLMKPTSPVFVFYVSVGKLDEISSDSVKYASSATTIKFSAIGYDALQKLTEPLCDDNVTDSASFGGASAIVVIVIIIIIFIIVLLLLCYAVYRYRKESGDNVTDSASFGGASAIVIIVIIVIIFIIVLLLLCYAVYRYRKESKLIVIEKTSFLNSFSCVSWCVVMHMTSNRGHLHMAIRLRHSGVIICVFPGQSSKK
ncbi:unnamed protein product [Toxocara canis]|uniref:Transmembrane domain-containing protein n=1 Tax=Toxocara canis TaxID=6265 RepID=A0A183V0P2_TOXCA|nr:unnamed protein product [Toxocara canis]